MFCELNHFHKKVLSKDPCWERKSLDSEQMYQFALRDWLSRTLSPKLHAGAELVSKHIWPLFCLHHHLCWEQISLFFNPWLMREITPHFAHWSVILLIWFRSFLYFYEYRWGGQLEVEKGRQMFSLLLQTRCCLTGSQKWINCLAHLCQ